MAEQYASFYGKGPNVDVNLFPNATSAGINQGNAIVTSPSTTATVLGGITSGIKDAISTVSGVTAIQGQMLQNEAQSQQNEINSDPAVIQARKEAIIANSQVAQDQAYKSGLEAAAIQANEENYSLQQTSALETAALIAQQTLGDTKNKRDIDAALTRGSPKEINSILNNPSMVQTMARDPKYGLSATSAMRGTADPTLLNSVIQKVDAVELEKRRIEMLGDEQKRKQQKALEFEDKASTAIAGIESNNGVARKKEELGGKFDARNLEMYPLDEVSVKDGKLQRDLGGNLIRKPRIGASSGERAYLMAYGDEVIEPYLSQADGTQNQKWLNDNKVYATAKGYPRQPVEAPAGAALNKPVPTEGTGLAGMAPASPVPTAAPGTNQNIVSETAQRNQRFFSQAQKSGNGQSYEALVSQGRQLGRPANMTKSEYLAPQSTPVPEGTPQITQPVVTDTPTTAAINTKAAGEERISQIVGAPVNLDVGLETVPQLNSAAVERIKSNPALNMLPAILQGLGLVESEGGKTSKNVFQFEPATAAGIGLKNVNDVTEAGPAAAKYLQIQYDAIEKQLNKTLASQGLSVKPDPRMVLAAYNGGLKWIVNGISAGNTTWPQMKEYLLVNKTKKIGNKTAGEINTEYPDKVILSSIPFIKGGNASDDAYVKTLIGFGIVDV